MLCLCPPSQAKESASSITPLHLQLGYQSLRSDLSEASYLTSQGVAFTADYQRSLSKWSDLNLRLLGALGYVALSDSEHLTPTVMTLQDQPIEADPTLNTPTQVSLARPSETTRSLGWRQRGSLGIGLKLEGDQEAWGIRMIGGAQWRGADENQISAWGCVGAYVQWIWIASALGGDTCVGLPEVGGRLLLGARLGRARLGAGWGVAERSITEVELSQGGPLGWARVPLSAPLYLELSAWYASRTIPRGDLTRGRVAGEGHLFSVSLRWTGEDEAPELEAPRSQSAPGTSPQAPGNAPSTPQPQSPFSPQPSPLTPLRPTAPPSTTPL